MNTHSRKETAAQGEAGRCSRCAKSLFTFAEIRRTEALGIAPLVIHSPGEMLSPTQGDESTEINSLPPAEKVVIDLVSYLPEELIFNVNCPADGWLLMTDRWARGWKAEVNGVRTPVYGGNFIFRAVRVSAGQNKIRFLYDPLAFPWLVMISWGTLAAIAGWSLRSSLGSPSDERRKTAGQIDA